MRARNPKSTETAKSTRPTTPPTQWSEQDAPDQQLVLRPLLVSIPQVLALLDIGRTTLYQLMADEELVPIRIGRSVRFVVSEVEAFVEARRAARHRQRSLLHDIR